MLSQIDLIDQTNRLDIFMNDSGGWKQVGILCGGYLQLLLFSCVINGRKSVQGDKYAAVNVSVLNWLCVATVV